MLINFSLMFVYCHSAKEFVQASLAQLPDPVAELRVGHQIFHSIRGAVHFDRMDIN